jgi:RHS repeat-associated protein
VSVRRRASGRVHYNYFRDYDPAVGRYAQSDPIGLYGGPNTYAYADGDPISRIDRRGLMGGKGPGVYGGRPRTAGPGGAYAGFGVQGSFHVIIAGANFSYGAQFVSNGQVCRTITICLRLGPGLFVGGGGYVGGGLVDGGGEQLGGFGIGGGGDIGFGPSAGGQGSIGLGDGGVSDVGIAKGKGGGGWGAVLGFDFCWTDVKCDMPSCDPNSKGAK